MDPHHCDDDHPECEEHRNPPEQHNGCEGKHDADERHPRIEGHAKTRVIGVEPTFTHDDHCGAQGSKDHQLDCAGILGNNQRIEEQYFDHNQCDSEEDRGGWSTHFPKPAEETREDVISSHSQWIAGRAQDASIGYRKEGCDGSN